ncbi:MAG: tetraacyldisaccharide 4'-kinase [Pseudomonadota bacterium]
MKPISDPLQRFWYSSDTPPLSLRLLSWLFVAAAAGRRRWQKQQARRTPLGLPVIVVGNINVGGSGKTPFVIWLVERLREWGWHPGIVSRGYGGRAGATPRLVAGESNPAECGDEPVLMARRLGCPVVVCPDRVAAVRALTRLGQVDVVISDDGLQHYRMARKLEFAVVDGTRGLGNGYRLPAGPLRESSGRLAEVNLTVVNGGGWKPPPLLNAPVLCMRLTGTHAVAIAGSHTKPLAQFAGETVHAVAGIGNPTRFFSMLTQLGIKLVVHPFPDHHSYRPEDFAFGDDRPVLMTEKDAVKCQPFADARMWSVPVQAQITVEDTARVRELIATLNKEI